MGAFVIKQTPPKPELEGVFRHFHIIPLKPQNLYNLITKFRQQKKGT